MIILYKMHLLLIFLGVWNILICIYIISYGKYFFSFRTFGFWQTFSNGLITKTEVPLYPLKPQLKG